MANGATPLQNINLEEVRALVQSEQERISGLEGISLQQLQAQNQVNLAPLAALIDAQTARGPSPTKFASQFVNQPAPGALGRKAIETILGFEGLRQKANKPLFDLLKQQLKKDSLKKQVTRGEIAEATGIPVPPDKDPNEIISDIAAKALLEPKVTQDQSLVGQFTTLRGFSPPPEFTNKDINSAIQSAIGSSALAQSRAQGVVFKTRKEITENKNAILKATKDAKDTVSIMLTRVGFDRALIATDTLIDLSERGTGPADIQLVKALQQFNDSPRVTQSEVELSKATNGISDRVRLFIKGLKAGDQLSPTQRKEFAFVGKAMRKIFIKNAVEKLRPEFAFATDQGLKLKQIFPPRLLKELNISGRPRVGAEKPLSKMTNSELEAFIKSNE